MRKFLIAAIMIMFLVIPAAAEEITAPTVPHSGRNFMPANTENFGEALLELLHNGQGILLSDFKEAASTGYSMIVSAMLCSIFSVISERLKGIASLVGAVIITSVIFQRANSMVYLASDTIQEILNYGKLLCQVMTAALAAQGGVTVSSSLYIGTTVFITVLNILIAKLVIPMVYLYLSFSVANCALGEEMLKQVADTIKGLLGWILKTLLIAFTTYMSITGAVAGTTDIAALKAAKVVISSVVPMVGGILSDSADSVLVSMGILKNAAGIYGILAVLSVFIAPFLKIGVHYLVLKVSASICSVFGNKNISTLVMNFSSAMGILLAVVGSGCVLILISTICFLKGIG